MTAPHFALVLTASLVGVAALPAEERGKKELISFGALRMPGVDEAKQSARQWLDSRGKTDEATRAAFDRIWSQEDRPLLDRVADTFSLGDEATAKLLADVNNSNSPAPTVLPPVLKDMKQPSFYRSNLALAYARALSRKRVYEEALDLMKTIKPEQVVEPAAYLFHRAVAEHALLNKDDATRSINRLLDDAPEAPERYRLVASLIQLDLQSWRDKDLGTIARKMDNIERRLELSRGGPHTQKLQKEVVSRIDELIKQLENQAQGQSQANANACPNGKPQQGQGQQQWDAQQNPNQPMQDSRFAENSGPGKVDPKKLEGIAKAWGKLPEKERAKAMQELVRDMPPEYRELIETYLRKLAQSESNRP